jgi:hypothetical protein
MRRDSILQVRKMNAKSVPAWLTQENGFPHNVAKLELSERDGDVFDLAFLRPPSFFSNDFKLEENVNLGTAGRTIEHPNLPEVYHIDNVLSKIECQRFVIAAESIGFFKSSGIGDATKTGKPCPPKAVLVIRPEQAEVIYQRIQRFLPQQFSLFFNKDGEFVERKFRIQGVNPRLRIHKYEEGFVLGPHYDRGAYRGSAMDASGELRFDYYGDDRHSHMSLLIYLTGDEDCSSGGETSFFPDQRKTIHSTKEMYDKNIENNISWARNVEKISINPVQGAAVAFFHGDNPLSPLHEGSEVYKGLKYIVRTDILYTQEHL